MAFLLSPVLLVLIDVTIWCASIVPVAGLQDQSDDDLFDLNSAHLLVLPDEF